MTYTPGIDAKEAGELEAGDVIRCHEDNQVRQVQSTFKADDQVHVDYTDGCCESYYLADVVALDTFD